MPIRQPYSLLIVFVCLCSYFAIHKTMDQARSANPFLHDQAGYYNYLPALFIYQDVEFSYLDTLKINKSDFVNTLKNKEGKDVELNRYGVGVAMLLSPFFALANVQAYFSGAAIDGFSSPYRSWIFGAQFFYLFLAFFLLRNLLLRYYQDKIVAVTLFTLALGTNLLYYALYEPVMSHNYSFFLFSLCLYWTIQWLETQKKRQLFLLAIAFGLLANVRLTNSIFILVLIFWEVGSFKELKARLGLFQAHWKALTVAVLLVCGTFLPQICYWYSMTGYWVVNSHGAIKGTFFWSDPVIFEILLGYKKGWLVYTPLMSLGILGLLGLYQQHRKLFWGIFVYTLVNFYVVSCWWCWWYGGSFGMRPLIESMVPLSFAFAAFLHWAFQVKWKQFLVLVIIIMGIGLNALQTYQYSRNYIHSFGMTKKAYWTVFGKVPPFSPEVYKEYDQYLLGVYMNKMTAAERAETKTYNERSEK